MNRILKALSFLRTLADAQDMKGVLESTRPEWDGTDAAHPCYWRGQDDGARGMQRKLVKEHLLQITELRAHYEAELAIARGTR